MQCSSKAGLRLSQIGAGRFATLEPQLRLARDLTHLAHLSFVQRQDFPRGENGDIGFRRLGREQRLGAPGLSDGSVPPLTGAFDGRADRPAGVLAGRTKPLVIRSITLSSGKILGSLGLARWILRSIPTVRV